MTAKRKPGIREKPAEYICTEKEIIKTLVENNSKLSIILVGNGDPKKGLFYQFTEFMADHKIIVNDINEIRLGVDGLHKRADENRDAAAKVNNAFNQYKIECESFDKGKASASTKGQVNFNNIISIVGTILVIIGLAANFLLSNKERHVITQKVDDLSIEIAPTRVIHTPIFKLPSEIRGDSIRDDSLMKVYR